MRRKPSTASIVGASLGPTTHADLSHKQKIVNGKSLQNSNLRTTSHGSTFQKITQQMKNDKPSLYQEEMEVTEVAAYDQH